MSATLIVMLVAFFIMLVLGVPIAFAIGGSAILSILVDGSISGMIVPQRMFVMLDSFSLMAVPLFILAGEIMSASGITHRIVRFASSLVGHLRAGLAHVCVLSSMLMAGISGSAAADASAIGSLMIPSMIDEGYDEDLAVAVCASANTIGPIIPPSIMMIIYGSMTGVSIGSLFLGGFGPGILFGLGIMLLVAFLTKKRGYGVKKRAGIKEVFITLKDAIWALLMPIIILGGILSGIFTATEAGAVACAYGFIVGFVNRSIKLKDIIPIFKRAVIGTAVPMFIIGIAAIFGWVMARYNFPQTVSAAMGGITSNPNVFILIVLLLYTFIGLFMEANAGMIIMVPVLAPIAQAYGFSLVHFGVLTVVTFCIGSITPPVGLLLFISSSIAKISLSKVSKTIWPFVAVLTFITALCALIPELVMAIPNLFM